MKRAAKKGFTLVEILIVVIILGILAAIVIPQFTQASTEAKVSSLRTNLQTIRSQLLLYKMQHDGEAYPTDFVDQMTKYTNAAGTHADAPDADTGIILGPYLQSIPVNPVTNKNGVVEVTGATTDFTESEGGGWWFNSTTGVFKADVTTSDIHKTADGTAYNAL